MSPKKAVAALNGRSSKRLANDAVKMPSQRPPSFFTLDPDTATNVFFVAHVIAALYAPIQDCDEVFNYWEPTHYLHHGRGLQTWEYSPEYAIRSWFYASLHAVITYTASWLLFMFSKTAPFYLLRLVFAYVCTKVESRLYITISRSMNPRIALFYLIATVSSTGMFHASVSYLPSTFSMYTVILALAAFLDWQGGIKTHHGLMWLAFGTIAGWPFVAVLALPFVLEDVALAWISGDAHEMLRRMFITLFGSLVLLTAIAGVDTFFYRKITIVSVNIILYNIFSGSGKGPDIYGTEAWHFYIRNLLINFNIWFLLACFAVPLLVYQHSMGQRAASKLTYLRSLVFVSPFYLWLAIFTVQPHKEERFMYPIYPCLALNAALSLHILILNLSNANSSTPTNTLPARLKLLLVAVFLTLATFLGAWRSLGLATAYSAPLKIYTPLHTPNATRPGNTVCLAKEWYRFPSSYHLPVGVQPKFLRSDFHGLLPGEFSEARGTFGFFPGAWLMPSGLNDENREDPTKYTAEDRCTFLVDSWFPGRAPSVAEPDRVGDEAGWEKVLCLPFLDAERTGWVGRLFWVPEWEVVPDRFRRRWGEYCLLKRRA